jgi:hypothetical protein
MKSTLPISQGLGETREVAFLKLEKVEEFKLLGRAYLITSEQFEVIQNRKAHLTTGNGHVLELGEMGGITVKSLTRIPGNGRQYTTNAPSLEYIDMLRRGLCETYPSMTVEEVSRYLNDILYSE